MARHVETHMEALPSSSLTTTTTTKRIQANLGLKCWSKEYNICWKKETPVLLCFQASIGGEILFDWFWFPNYSFYESFLQKNFFMLNIFRHWRPLNELAMQFETTQIDPQGEVVQNSDRGSSRFDVLLQDCRSSGKFLRFSLSPRYGATTVNQNCYNIINATQDNSCN